MSYSKIETSLHHKLVLDKVIVQEKTIEIEKKVTQDIAEYFNLSFMDILFEVVSAFATVGLTLGATTQLSLMGKFIIIMLMIIGRLGPITISIALFKKCRMCMG